MPANDQTPVQQTPVEQAPAQQSPTPEQTLAILRVLWGVLLVGQLLLIGVAAMVINSNSDSAIKPELTLKLFGLNAGLLVVNVILGTFIRSQIYKRSWRGHVVSPLGYFTGNVVMLALLEMVIFFGILVSILSKSFMPSILPAVLAMMVYGVNYPHGGPMFGKADPDSLNFIKTTPEAVTAADAANTTSAETDTEPDADLTTQK